MVPHAADRDPRIVHGALGGVDLAQQLERDRRTVGETRRQARERGLLPHLEPHPFRKRPHVGFREAALRKRTAHAEFGGGFAPGPVVGRVVEVESVDDRCCAPFARDRGERPVQFFLTVIAAIRRIRCVVRVVDFVGLDDVVHRAAGAREFKRPVELSAG